MNTKLLSYVVKTSLFLPFLWDRFWAFFYKKSMGSCGKNVMLKPATSVFKGIENFYIASDVRIARYAVIYLHIPADTRSAFPVISVQSPVSIQCCWQS